MHEELLKEWWTLRDKLEKNRLAMADTVAKEFLLRQQLMSTLFPGDTLKEGVNNFDYEGWTLKCTHKIDRKVDKAVLPVVTAELEKQAIYVTALIRNTPELNIKEYKLFKKEREEAGKIFDQALIIRPSAPTIELVPPKTK